MNKRLITTGMDLREARLSLGLNMAQFGRACGMTGENNNINRQIGAYERDERPIPRHIILLTECFMQGARPSSWPV
jgi:transcriptional regulator with XRE-family HTH domain